MTAPLIQFYQLDAGSNELPGQVTLAQFVSATNGAVKAGTQSAIYRLRVYNDKGATDGSIVDATDLDITTVASPTNAVTTGRWCLTSMDNGSTFDSPGSGIGDTNIKAFPGDLADGAFQDVWMKMDVPSNASASTYNFLLRVSYSYT